jgi:iron(III) transport system ATP-binding protein
MIRIENLQMTYRTAHARHHAVRGASLVIEEGSFYTLLGPSGCGKTTILRCVAGLEQPDSGEITIGDEVVYSSARRLSVPSYKRRIGMVFQSYAIWPHMTVFENVAFPLRYVNPRPTAKEMSERARLALELVKLGGLEDRPAPFLSGGQQQRLALARALVGEPKVLLLDEPLSNLDAKLRDEMRSELSDLVGRLNVTTLYVTHEQAEALTMSDVVAVMNNGRIVQEGSAEDIYARPLEPFVADFVGRTNIVSGTVTGSNASSRRIHVATEIGTIEARAVRGVKGDIGEPVAVTIRPENMQLGPAETSQEGARFSGSVRSVVYLGNLIDCIVAIGSIDFRIQLHPSQKPAPGTELELFLPAEQCLAMPRADEASRSKVDRGFVSEPSQARAG